MISKAIDTGGPAFPRPASEFTKNGTLPDGNDAIHASDGMTLRDWFAGQALVGMTAYSGRTDDSYTCESRAASAYAQADAMIAARGKVS